ncbi:hypothetical protein GBAR_LOCUS11954, partial [Geodia barretti]
PCGLGLDVTEGVVVTKAVFRSPPSTDWGAVKIVCERKIIMKKFRLRVRGGYLECSCTDESSFN